MVFRNEKKLEKSEFDLPMRIHGQKPPKEYQRLGRND